MADVRIGIDVGGTFTDGVMVRDGTLTVAKVPSRRHDISGAILECCRALDADLAEASLFIHGTTVSTNAIIEKTGAPIAHITTAGYRDILFIRRGDSEPFNLHWQPPLPVVRRRDIYEIQERLAWDGSVTVPFDEAGARMIARVIAEKGYEAASVTFLHSYANAAHEVRMKEVLQEECPGILISTSADVLPQYREFERSSTTAVNAYLMPLVREYLRDLGERMRNAGFRHEPLIMQSNGGVTTVEEAEMRPARTVRSGPAGCAIAAASVAEQLEIEDAIFFDMGGTSTEVSVLHSGEIRWTPEIEFAWGVPIRFPSVAVQSIGAGGGSIAWVEAGRFLKVGPHSAGADPGPACYGKGGLAPTTTDAQVVLGRLSPAGLLGGEMSISPDLAEDAVRREVGEPLGLDVVEAAAGIVDVNTHNMLQAIRLMTVNRGVDPKLCSLLALGGSGPLYAAELANLLGVSEVLVPPYSGLASAMGMVLSDFRYDASRTLLLTEADLDLGQLDAAFEALEAEVSARLAAVNDVAHEQILRRTLDMRYQGQGFELSVPFGEVSARQSGNGRRRLPSDAFAESKSAFHAVHEREFGWREEAWPVEVVFARVTGEGIIGAKPTLQSPSHEHSHEKVPTRLCHFLGIAAPLETVVVRRSALGTGDKLAGPAIVEQMDTTTLVPPEWDATVDPGGNLRLAKAQAPS